MQQNAFSKFIFLCAKHPTVFRSSGIGNIGADSFSNVINLFLIITDLHQPGKIKNNAFKYEGPLCFVLPLSIKKRVQCISVAVIQNDNYSFKARTDE
jgi:hypothetical protein